jgi:Peduoviridae DNA polymerase exonuclease subunit
MRSVAEDTGEMMRGPDYQQDRKSAVEWAVQVMALEPVFLDTETTGLDDAAEICDIAVVDYDGVVLFDTLINPSSPIPDTASDIHGITNAMVAGAPRFEQVLDRLDKALQGRPVVIYNLAYDTRLISQSCAAPFHWWWLPGKDETLKSYGERPDRWHCAMNQYAQYAGDWNDYHQSYRWAKLGNAALQCGVVIHNGLHRARVDAELTRQIVRYMAAQMDK